MILATLALAAQTTWYVDASATPPGQGTQAAPFVRIDDTIANPSVVNGDTVLVLPGDYNDEAIDFLGKDITVRSSDGTSATTIRGVQGATPTRSTVRFVSGETQSAVLEGFTIETSDGEPWTWPDPSLGSGITPGGGAVFCHQSSPTLRQLVIVSGGGSQNYCGGGVALEDSSAIIQSCEFTSIFARAAAGVAILNSTPLISDCSFEFCRSTASGGTISAIDSNIQMFGTSIRGGLTQVYGGGIKLSGGSLVAQSCELSQNVAADQGGALHASGYCELRESVFSGNGTKYPGGAVYGANLVIDCEFSGNGGERGGAIFMGTGQVINTLFRNNQASTITANSVAGGAIYSTGVVEVRGSTFIRNSIEPLNPSGFPSSTPGGADIYGTATVDRCTFVDSVSRAGMPSVLAGGAASTVTNSIIVNPTAPAFGSATVTFSNVGGGWPGSGNVDQDPEFWDLANDDLHLLPSSPAIDAGSPASPADPDGTIADQGAMQFDPLYWPTGYSPALGTTICASNRNSTGTFASLAALGSTTTSLDRLILNVTGSPSNTFGFYLGSRSQGFYPLGGGSQGLLCLGSPVLRFDGEVLTDRGTGVVSFHPRLASFPQGQAALPGDTWYFQYWFRDFNGGITSNTSGAIRVDFQ